MSIANDTDNLLAFHNLNPGDLCCITDPLTKESIIYVVTNDSSFLQVSYLAEDMQYADQCPGQLMFIYIRILAF